MVSILVLINLISLGFLWFAKSGPGFPERPDKKSNTEHLIQKRLQLSNEQMRQFKQERERHFQTIRPIEKDLRSLRKDLFEMNVQGVDSDKISPKLHQIRQLQGEIDSLTYRHFATLRSYCKEEQIDEFNALLKHMLRRGLKNDHGPDRQKRQGRPIRK